MYNVGDIGRRIAKSRKDKGMTQDELAGKLRITAQAISKWENGASFPDITLMPQIAEALNLTVEYLFGNFNPETLGYRFQETYEQLRLVHSYNHIACYSNKTVQQIDEAIVVFEDGSTAFLPELGCENVGPGEIRFLELTDMGFVGGFTNGTASAFTDTEITKEFTQLDSLELEVNACTVKIHASGSETTVVYARGSSWFLSQLQIEKQGTLLKVLHRSEGSNGRQENNQLDIALGSGLCESLSIRVNGSGVISNSEFFKSASFSINGSGVIQQNQAVDKAKVTINGSGDVKLMDVNEELNASINGSGDVHCKKCGGGQMSINGSGDIEMDELQADTASLLLKINGSGDIKVKSGYVDFINISIMGSGDFNGEGLTARNAELYVKSSGDIVLGRVLEKSKEKHGKGSKIQVLHRGKE